MSLIREVQFCAAFSFKYSRRPGTPAAAMPGQVAEEVKDDRLAHLQALIAEQQMAFNKGTVGKTLDVLFEKRGRHGDQAVGKSPYLQAVHVDGAAHLIGQIAPVRMTGTAPNSLKGALLEKTPA